MTVGVISDMAKRPRQGRRTEKERRSIFLSFEFEKDASRPRAYIGQAEEHCDFALTDKSLPEADHSDRWRRDAKRRIEASDVVIVLLGPDTHNAPGVKDELSLAGEVGCPVVQLMPQDKTYGLVAKNRAVCDYKWDTINLMLRDPKAFAGAEISSGK